MGDSASDKSSDELPPQELSAKDALIAALGRDFSNYTHDGNFCVYMKLVHDRNGAESDIKEDTFFPDFVHQFFVDQERIFGYKKPVIRLFYTASRLKRYVKFDYQDKLSKEKDGIEPDDVMDHLSVILKDLEYTQDLNQFIIDLESKEEKEFRPSGDLLHEFENKYSKPSMLSRAQLERMAETSVTNGDSTQNGGSSLNGNANLTNGHLKDPSSSSRPDSSCTKKYQIYHANVSTKGFRHFQARMQTLVMWFIESATMIDFEDDRWDFFLVFEKFNQATSEDPTATSISTEDRFYFAGYATVYRYYAYPNKTRPCVSQMVMLPPYRRNGLGTALLQAIYDYYIKLPATLDITVEDPDEDFISMRDFLDCKNCLKLSNFQPDKLKQGWSQDKAREAQERLKLCQRQSRKVYEILRLRVVDPSDKEELRNYRIEVKRRLNAVRQKMKQDCDKVAKRGIHVREEMLIQSDTKLHQPILEENYHLLERQYKHIIEKMEQSCAT